MRYIILLLLAALPLAYLGTKLLPNYTKTQLTSQVSQVRETLTVVPTVISPPTSLPNYHLIKTTFVPQAPEGNWDQPWQDTCEEAALLTGYFYLTKQEPNLSQIKQSILDLLDYQTVQGWGKDINLTQMQQIASQSLNMETKIIDNPTIDDIKKEISQNHPIVIPAAGKILFQENKNFQNGGPDYHNLTILGFDDTKQQFITHDVGTRKGAYFHYSYTLLMESIHDLPPSGDKHEILSGDRKILVLLK